VSSYYLAEHNTLKALYLALSVYAQARACGFSFERDGFVKSERPVPDDIEFKTKTGINYCPSIGILADENMALNSAASISSRLSGVAKNALLLAPIQQSVGCEGTQ
jgi:hypothetical protein